MLWLDSNEWVAVATLGLVFATVQLSRVARNQAIATSMTTQQQLLDQLDSSELRSIRRRLASGTNSYESCADELIELLSVIEHIATAIRRRALDFRTVWSSSFGDVIYFHIDEALDLIQKKRETEPTYFEDLLWYRRKATRMIFWRNVLARISGILHRRSNLRRSHYCSLIESIRTVEQELSN
jgi:hypothetical protein